MKNRTVILAVSDLTIHHDHLNPIAVAYNRLLEEMAVAENGYDDVDRIYIDAETIGG